MSPEQYAALRADFEAAVRENHKDRDDYVVLVLQRDSRTDDYTTTWVNAAWWGWQEHARRADRAPTPGVLALRTALARHDSAAMELFGRDDQVAWIGKGPGPAAYPVTVDQLREVLVAALGLPAGTKYGG